MEGTLWKISGSTQCPLYRVLSRLSGYLLCFKAKMSYTLRELTEPVWTGLILHNSLQVVVTIKHRPWYLSTAAPRLSSWPKLVNSARLLLFQQPIQHQYTLVSSKTPVHQQRVPGRSWCTSVHGHDCSSRFMGYSYLF